MTKTQIQNIASDIVLALEAVGKRHNVEIKRGPASFGEVSANLKLVITEINKAGTVESPKRNDYLRYCGVYGLKLEWLDAEIKIAGDSYTISGLNSNNPKNVVQITRTNDGKTFKCPQSTVTAAMGRNSINTP